ncbi:MAG: nucleotidyltransferase domain-containing protein [bacterium]
MRLLDIEKKALAHALNGVEGVAYLYGSRTDPLGKGGDIDLLVFSHVDSPYRLSQKISVRFRMECDEKIDVLVVNPERISEEQKPFLELIKREALLIQ